MWRKTMSMIATDTFSLLLRISSVLWPSRSKRRTIRSITSAWGMPSSSIVWGIDGANTLRRELTAVAKAMQSVIRRVGLGTLSDNPLDGPTAGQRLESGKRHIYLKLFRIGVCLLALAGLAYATPKAAAQLSKKARKAEKKGRIVEAYLFYSEAAAADPENPFYWQKSQALRTRAATAAHAMPPRDVAAEAAPEAASDAEAPPEDLPAPTPKDLDEARKPQPPTELAAKAGSQTFDLKGDSKTLWETLARSYGLDVVFDGDYQASSPIRFNIGEATYAEALYALETATSSFIVPVSPKLFMVVKDTPQKRTEVETTVAITIPIPEPVSIQEAQELARGVQQLFELTKFAIDSGQRLVFIRGPVSKVEPARIVFRDLLLHKPQMFLEFEILSLSKIYDSTYGIPITNSYQLLAPLGVTNLFAWTGGLGAIQMTVATVQLLAHATDSVSTTMLRTQLRTVDGQAATLRFGDKYPIVTMTFAGGGVNNATSYYPPPLFQFEDLGLTLKATPKVHGDEGVTLDIELEYKALGAGGLDGIPVISNRKYTGRARLKFGEEAVLAGLMSESEARTIAGFAGLTDVPVVGPLTSQVNRHNETADILVVVRPVLIDSPRLEIAAQPIWTGTESRPKSPI